MHHAIYLFQENRCLSTTCALAPSDNIETHTQYLLYICAIILQHTRIICCTSAREYCNTYALCASHHYDEHTCIIRCTSSQKYCNPHASCALLISDRTISQARHAIDQVIPNNRLTSLSSGKLKARSSISVRFNRKSLHQVVEIAVDSLLVSLDTIALSPITDCFFGVIVHLSSYQNNFRMSLLCYDIASPLWLLSVAVSMQTFPHALLKYFGVTVHSGWQHRRLLSAKVVTSLNPILCTTVKDLHPARCDNHLAQAYVLIFKTVYPCTWRACIFIQ